ncbi:MAG: hypothetical protein JRN24_02650 [Nitrososphaerota archaeon]|nr:hypothetical protein [Nitrososphaerota archaeon]
MPSALKSVTQLRAAVGDYLEGKTGRASVLGAIFTLDKEIGAAWMSSGDARLRELQLRLNDLTVALKSRDADGVRRALMAFDEARPP